MGNCSMPTGGSTSAYSVACCRTAFSPCNESTIPAGRRASYLDVKAMQTLARSGFRYYMFAGNDEDAVRIAGITTASATLQQAGVSFERGSAPGGHIAAPPEVFDRALRYVLGLPEAKNPAPAPQALSTSQDGAGRLKLPSSVEPSGVPTGSTQTPSAGASVN